MKIPSLLLLLLLSFQLQLAQNSIQDAINSLVKVPILKHAGVSISVLDDNGQIIASYNPQLSLIPASSLKVVTTASALAILGSDYQFKTEIQYDGTIGVDGILNGNIYIKGYGDPTLGSDQMDNVEELVDITESFRLALQRKGIRQVDGYVIADATHFESAANAPTWPWNDLGNYYASGVYGLNIHENQYYLRFQQTSNLGETPDIAKVEPLIPGLKLTNELESAGKNTGDNAYIFGAPYNFNRYVRGTIPVGNRLFSIKGSIPDPPLFAAQFLVEKMDEIGIVCKQGATTLRLMPQLDNNQRKTLSIHRSPALNRIVNRANQKSINLYCEAMLKEIGMKKEEKGTTQAGLEAIRAYWESKGMDFAGAFLEDGSGLSPRNNVSSYFLASMMLGITKDADLYQAFEPSLPIAGVSGTLKTFLRGTAAQGKIKAKSGSMARVRSYTGYAMDKKGNQITFAIIVNNYTGNSRQIRGAIGNVLEAMCE